MAAEALTDSGGLPARMATAATRLGRGYVELAQREAQRDIARIAVGLGLLAFAAALGLAAVFVGHALVIALIWEQGIALSGALGIVLGADLLLALIAALIGRGRITQPVLSETRAVVQETLAVLSKM